MDLGTAKPVSKIGLGTHQFGSPEWGYGVRYARGAALAIVRRALELGVTLFDTSEIYGFQAGRLARRAMVHGIGVSDTTGIPGFGLSERILGQALDGRREAAFLATKVYPLLPAEPVPERRALASANRLGTGYLDLYQVHENGIHAPSAGFMRGIAALRQAGVISEVGVSNASLARWQAAECALGHRVLSNQVGYSLLDRAAERSLLPFAARHRRLVIAAHPLERGLLAGTYDLDRRPGDEFRSDSPLFLPENIRRAGPLLAVLREVARGHAATPAQVALAWVIRHPAVAAIPGASSVEQLEANAAAADLELADDEYAALADASARFRPVPGPGFLVRRARGLRRRRPAWSFA